MKRHFEKAFFFGEHDLLKNLSWIWFALKKICPIKNFISQVCDARIVIDGQRINMFDAISHLCDRPYRPAGATGLVRGQLYGLHKELLFASIHSECILFTLAW